MSETHYLISDASKKVDVESHVLRYWEEELEMKREDMIWSDRKRNWLGLPWTFTVYGLTEDRLFIKTGVLNIHEDEVRLYRILDLSLRRSFWQRIVGLGTIHVDSP